MKTLQNLTIVFLFTHVFSLHAQKFKDESGAGFIFGASGLSTLFLADIGDPIKETYIFSPQFGLGTNTVLSIGFKQNITGNLSYKLIYQHFDFGRKDIKYSFKSNLNQLSSKLSLNLFKLNTRRFSAIYIETGFGYVYGTVINDNSVQTPLKSYSLPLGAGYKINLNPRFSMGIEPEINYFFTGKIDGKENTGSLWPQDIATSISMTVSYKLFNKIKIEKKCFCDWD